MNPTKRARGIGLFHRTADRSVDLNISVEQPWGFVVLLRRRGIGKRWNVGVKALTGLLMLYFAARSLQELLAG